MSVARNLGKFIKRSIGDRKGSVGIIFGFAFLPALLIGGGAIDYAQALRSKTVLQKVTDAAALAGSAVLGGSEHARTEAATAVFEANLPDWMQDKVDIHVEASLERVRVTASFDQPTSFMKLVHVDSIGVDSAATVVIDTTVVNGSVCLLALNKGYSVKGIELNGTTALADDKCWAWSNSKASDSLYSWGTASAQAAGFCAAGGIVGTENFHPGALSDCAQRKDPFQDLEISWEGSCTATNKKLANGTYTLNPGVYCGGLELKPHADVHFEPGVYVIKDGTFQVQAGARAWGDGVTIIFSGGDANLSVKGGGDFELKAPKSGQYAGFLLVDDRINVPHHEVDIQGGGRVEMEGILYMPKREVTVGGNGVMNQDSKFFAMVADHFYFYGNGTVYLRTDAASTGYPEILDTVKRLTRMTE